MSDAYDDDAFQAAYDKVMARWPAQREAVRVPTPYGTTHVNACGPYDGPPLVLLPGGGGATSASWFAQAADFAGTHRVYAVDLVGAPGRSTAAGDRHPRTIADLTAWLDAVLDGLGAGPAVLGGHSYGAWIALHHALHAPARVRRLFLLDPDPVLRRVQGGVPRACPADAAAALAAPGPRQEAATGFPSVRPVTGPRPAPLALRALDMPVLLLLAGNSRTHDTYWVAARASAVLPRVETVVLPDVSHHALPHAAPAELGRRLSGFLRG
ncbi:alpha/beta fold hydrolase [Streptomyces sp. PSKA30]|uniref:alpha/beta fold hydrolase n=1 Tax=Streptomyces sp. PSKA30 TaxID=2874597 RepID=UPI001CD13DAD|nr:alpha/beta hydrolase [Streptomyces sp. PSKA30]MBZ9643919.1 alpha/beta hydrolase [Streptomyces sp. PSKA30]